MTSQTCCRNNTPVDFANHLLTRREQEIGRRTAFCVSGFQSALSGRKTPIGCEVKKQVFVASIYTWVYTMGMSTHSTPHSLLQQIAQITRMEPGKLCVMRQGPDGPYYSLQCREEGKPVARYVPREEAELVASHTAN
jgi:hypothetical protein